MTTRTDTETKPELSHGSGNAPRPRHIVEFNRETGEHEEKTLCGELWDKLNVRHNGAICQACVDEQKRRLRWEDE